LKLRSTIEPTDYEGLAKYKKMKMNSFEDKLNAEEKTELVMLVTLDSRSLKVVEKQTLEVPSRKGRKSRV
jgi:hypothetical protein